MYNKLTINFIRYICKKTSSFKNNKVLLIKVFLFKSDD